MQVTPQGGVVLTDTKSELKHPEKIGEGKTKIIWASGTKMVAVESKDDITAGDGARREVMESKAYHANKTTVNCFELLKSKGMKTHFIRLGGKPNTFMAHRLNMIPFEVVVRFIAFGSYLKRHPTEVEGRVFDTPIVEFFLKDDSRHDPLIKFDFRNRRMILYDAKLPQGSAPIGEEYFEKWMVGGREVDHHMVIDMAAQALHATLYVREAWQAQDVVMVDIKVEFGLDIETGQVLLGDVIDNDSWRIWLHGKKEGMLDKQPFRDMKDVTPEGMAALKKNYATVAEMTSRFLDKAS